MGGDDLFDHRLRGGVEEVEAERHAGPFIGSRLHDHAFAAKDTAAVVERKLEPDRSAGRFWSAGS